MIDEIVITNAHCTNPSWDRIVKEYHESIIERRKPAIPAIGEVIFHDPATIIYWEDGDKTVVKCGKGSTYDPEKGLAMAICKKVFGNKGNYYRIFRKYLPKEE